MGVLWIKFDVNQIEKKGKTLCFQAYLQFSHKWFQVFTSQECWEQSWTSPGSNIPQDTSCTATCLPSRKLHKLDEPDTQDSAGEAMTNSSVMYSYGPPHMTEQKQDDQLEHTYSSYVRIRDVALKTRQKRWTIGRGGERGSGISVLVARHDDDWWFTSNTNFQSNLFNPWVETSSLLRIWE